MHVAKAACSSIFPFFLDWWLEIYLDQAGGWVVVGVGLGGWHALDILTGCSRGGRPGGPPPVPAPALSLQRLPTPASFFRPVSKYKCRHRKALCVPAQIANQGPHDLCHLMQSEMSALFSWVPTWVHFSLIKIRELACQLSRIWEECKLPLSK
jgi:hypothetical protein